jgi:hypothetical protein
MFKERNLDRFQKPGEMFSSQSVGQFFFLLLILIKVTKSSALFLSKAQGERGGKKER